ncbi:hypothetical protein [Mastigocladopsis repens]|uniref:hypothetical protein n=1 Tax=Mastigocladopsis repens TaxID=221287 RepID=UPI0002E394AF|nr:hypothetical protein [Mastigocladopsis repens]
MLNLFPKFSVAFAPQRRAFYVLATAALSTAVITTSQAQASTVTYDFTVNVTKGSLAGKSYNGTFSYDDSTLKGTGVEELGVSQGLTVCMNYFGRNYSETDDHDYPALPKLVFENGKIKQLDFWIQPNKRVVWWNLPGWEVKLSMRKASGAAVPNCQKR